MDLLSDETLALATLVAAYVGVAKGLGLKVKWVNLAAVGIAAVFVLVPTSIREKIIEISIVGLSATGTYQLAKKKEGK
ncbi:hypothetical protein [Paenibacillus riograndensis]|uniref:Putative membrane protein n=1 Tax=Paenibacillus riograndensis SBR5 TaxID=1073571 RepID=A0A0E4H6A7_9BACL|nr:hypothetical protein [Paenibacillus riograndensis]CQR51492.1 putative membrane protein [Paenibacillus riograndensis SBR5]